MVWDRCRRCRSYRENINVNYFECVADAPSEEVDKYWYSLGKGCPYFQAAKQEKKG